MEGNMRSFAGATLVILAVAIMLLSVGATPASAEIAANYRGWAYTADGFSAPIAWRWTGTRWTQVNQDRLTRVWVQPFGKPWVWTWKSSKGWLAMRVGQLYYSDQRCYGMNCPIF
jgi:hypothetical protein